MKILFNDDDPWNVSGKGHSNKGGKNGRSGEPIDISAVIENLQGKFKKGGSGGNGGNTGKQKKFPFLLAILALGFVWLFSGVFKVDEGEVSVVLRFGEYVRMATPGLAYRLPYPIEQNITRNIAEVNRVDSSTTSVGSIGSDNDKSLILTGDENMVLTNYTVLWKIKDLRNFLFRVRNPINTVQVAAESAIREVIGQTTARLALTSGRETIGNDSVKLLQKILDSYDAGVQIISIQLQRVEPPEQVIDAFNDMQASLVDADRLQNEAQSYRNDILPRARGKAASILKSAEAYAEQVVANAQGQVSRFTNVYRSYKLNPKVARVRMHREKIAEVLEKGNVTIVDDKLSKSIHNYAQLAAVPGINRNRD